MSACETTHWTLDCGDGHACYLAEYSDTGELAGWGCQSEPVKGRPRLEGKQTPYIDGKREIMFCCNDITRAALAEALDDLYAGELIVPKGTHSERVSMCATAPMDQIVADIGLSVRR
jgi:hypothetical protein